jgi:hypothetical protein
MNTVVSLSVTREGRVVREVHQGWSAHPKGTFGTGHASFYEGTYSDEEALNIMSALRKRYQELKALVESGRCRTKLRGDTRFWYHPETEEPFARQALVQSLRGGFEPGALMIIGCISDVLPPGCEYNPIVWE